MKSKMIYLLFLYCYILHAFTLYGNQGTIDNLSLGLNKIQKNRVTDTIKLDTIVEQEAIQMIEGFYKAYTIDFLYNTSSSDLLIKKYLTKKLIGKIDRLRTAMDVDPIIRAQDFREDVVESLNAKHLDGNWYMVSYMWDGKQTNIPLRVTQTNGQYMIDYITPEWNNTLYGDSLLFDNPILPIVDASAPLCFLKTFYAAYTMEYCSMPEDLMCRLTALRATYCTPNALAQFEDSANEYKLNGHLNYDLLIDYFDFDRLWIPSIKFSQADEYTYLISYIRRNTSSTIEIKVIKQGKEYRIDNIVKYDR